MNRPTTLRQVALLGSLLTTAAVHAQTPDATLETLDQKVRILERKLELQDEEAAKARKESPVLTAGEKGFALTSADKAFELKLRGYVQADARFYLADDGDRASDTFQLRRVRPILEGTLFRDYEYRLMPDFGGGSTTVQDAYLGYNASPFLKFRAGKFKAPFGLERLQSGTSTLFIERGHPTSLAPNRDVGLQLSGDPLDGALHYAVGLFNGVADGGSSDRDTTDDKDVVGRLFLTPFKNSDSAALSGLSVGVAASAGAEKGTTSASGLASYRSLGQINAFAYRTSTNAADAVVADGDRTRFSPQALYYAGPFGLLAEYVLAEHEVRRGENATALENEAWQVAASYVLTGESTTFRGVTPRKPFDLTSGQWGALQIAARYGELNVDEASFPTYADLKRSAQAIQSWGIGLNWYLNKNILAVLNYDTSKFDGGATTGDRPDEEALFARFQVSF